VTFAPRQLASYTTPNFFTGEAASVLREASKTVQSGSFASRIQAAPLAHAQGKSLPSSRGAGPQHVPVQSSLVSPSSDDHTDEPAAKRRSRERQPTQTAIDAGLAPALAGQQGRHSPTRGVSPTQDAQQSHAKSAALVQSLSAAPSAQHLQAGMPV